MTLDEIVSGMFGGMSNQKQKQPTAPQTQLGGLGAYSRGYAQGGLLSGLDAAFNGTPEDRARLKAEQEAAAAKAQENKRLNMTMQVLRSKAPQLGLTEDQLRLAETDPEIRNAFVKSYLMPQAPAKPEYREVGGRLVQVGPDGVKEVYAPPTGANANSPEARAALARQYGIQEGTPEFQQYVLTGDMPRQGVLTATDRKAILDADDQIRANEAVVTGLGEAKRASGNAYEGFAADTRAWLGNSFPDVMIPDFIASPERSADTSLLNQATTSNALTQLKAIFGGAPTEGERKILLEIQGAASQPKAVREDIFRRAKEMAERRIALQKREADQLRGGTYYKPGGGMSGMAPTTSQTPNAPPPAAIEMLRQDMSPAAMAEFDQVFGPGAAQRALANGR